MRSPPPGRARTDATHGSTKSQSHCPLVSLDSSRHLGFSSGIARRQVAAPRNVFVDRARVETKGQQHSKCWPVQTGASTRAVTQLFCTLDKAGSAARALHAPFTARTYHTRRFLTCTKFLQVNNFERKKKNYRSRDNWPTMARHGLRTRPPGGEPEAADGDEAEAADGDGRRTPSGPIPHHTHILHARAPAPYSPSLLCNGRFAPASRSDGQRILLELQALRPTQPLALILNCSD